MKRKRTFIAIVLFIGLIVGVTLVQTRQILQSRAQLQVESTFSFSDTNGRIPCEGSDGETVCKTDAESVVIDFDTSALPDILNALP